MALSTHGIKHKFVPLDAISKNLRNAVIAAEDDRFFEHDGVDTKAAKEAFKRNLKKKKFAYGASTISMQLARNLYLSPKKSIPRKSMEILIALKLERTLSKKRILELYLNYVQFGCGIFGAEAGARHYFGISAKELGKNQAAFLAALLPRPCYYDKRRSSKYLLKRMEIIESRI